MSNTPAVALDMKHRQVINYYFQGLSKKAATMKAGFSALSAQDIFKRPDVREELDRRMTIQEHKTDMDREWLVDKLRDIIEASPADLLEVDDKGRPSMNWERLTPGLRKAISTITVDTSKDGGKYKKVKTNVKITTSDKLGAIKEAAVLLGLREEKKVIDIEDNLVKILMQKRQEKLIIEGKSEEIDEDGKDSD